MSPAYTSAVLECFARAGDTGSGPLLARRGTLQQGVVIEFRAVVADGCLKGVGFRVWGCPHIIAACVRLTELFEGGPLDLLVSTNLETALAEFDIPVEKAGKILILKDTLEDAHEVLRSDFAMPSER